MDELPPIRNLSLTQQRIRDALRNAPPLTITKPPKDNILIFDDQNKKSKDSLFDRFLKHKSNESKNCPQNKETKKSCYKWYDLKDKMIEELEIKRMESLKHKEVNEKIENEEIDDELITHLDKEVHKNSDIQNKLKPIDVTQEDNSKQRVDKETDSDDEMADHQSCNEEVSEEQSGDEEVSEEQSGDEEVSEEQSGDEEVSEEQSGDEEVSDEQSSDEDLADEQSDEEEDEEERSDRKRNPFIDDEADDDINDNSDDDRSDSFEMTNHRKSLDNEVKDTDLDTSFNVFEESFESRRQYATQKIAFSPFLSQKPKSRFDSKKDFSELISDFNSINDEFNSQSLLDLCSGNFSDNQINGQSKKDLESSQSKVVDKPNDSTRDDFEDELLTKPKVSKIFNIESDGESDEDIGNDYKNKELKSSFKNFNGSDGEELIVTDEEEETEDYNKEVNNVNAFFDDEAELSGSEVSSDEEDDLDDTQDVEDEEEKEDLPSDSEIEKQNLKIFNKQILDEEKRNIMIWKERLFEDGDLHDSRQKRQKKFRWNFDSDDNFINDYINEDSDDNLEIDDDSNQKIRTPTLKMTENNSNLMNKTNNTLEKFKIDLKQNFKLKNINKNVSESNNNSISAFVVKDERLKTLMSTENKRSLNSKNKFKSNKKFKNSKKETKTSIFDLF